MLNRSCSAPLLAIPCACCTTKYNENFLSYRMQGRKKFAPKLFYQTSLENLVPENDSYRLIQKEMDFHYLYGATSKYYGSEGQESIDPVVFFKILLVGYLYKINSANIQPENYLKFTCKTPQIIALKMTFGIGLLCFLQNQQYSHQNRGYKLS
jgi:hypothetical protein